MTEHANCEPRSHTGEIVRSCSVAGLRLVEATYPALLTMPRHSHDDAYFSVVLQGAYTEHIGWNAHACRTSMVAFHPPGGAHSVEFHERVRIFRVEVGAPWLERVRQYSRVLDDFVEVQSGPPAYLAARLYQEFRLMDELAPLAIEGLALEILAAVSREAASATARTPPRWLLQARDQLRSRFTENLSVDEVAAASGVHPVHLSRMFRAHFRSTMGEYVRRLRVDFACREIASSRAPLGEIALAAGFTDQAHLTRTFRQITGMAPTEYKKAVSPR